MKICNCANCKVEMSSDVIFSTSREDVKPIGGRIKGRPYCSKCLVSYHGIGGRSGIYKGETSPGWDNAVRAIEDGTE